MAKSLSIDTLFDLLGILRSGSTIALEELSEQSGLEIKELERALEMLASIDVGLDYIDLTIEGDQLVVGNLPVVTRQVLKLNQKQMLAFILALRLGGVPESSELYQSMASSLSHDWGSDLFEDFFRIIAPAHSFDVFRDLAIGHKNSWPVEIEYLNTRGVKTTRRIDVANLSIEREGWYVHGFDHTSREPRTFKLGRILSSSIISLVSSKAKDNLQAVRDSLEALECNIERNAMVRFARRADYVPRDWPMTRSARMSADGSLTISVDISNKAWLANRIVELGGQAQVVAPLSLRAEIAQLARAKYEEYRASL